MLVGHRRGAPTRNTLRVESKDYFFRILLRMHEVSVAPDLSRTESPASCRLEVGNRPRTTRKLEIGSPLPCSYQILG